MKKLINKTKNGVEVFLDPEKEHMIAHRGVNLDHIAQALEKIIIEKGQTFLIKEIDLNNFIAIDDCVLNSPERGEPILVTRIGRAGKTPAYINQVGTPTSKICLGICQDKDDSLMSIFTSFYGQLAPKEPWDPRIASNEELEESKQFWNTHSLCISEDLIEK